MPSGISIGPPRDLVAYGERGAVATVTDGPVRHTSGPAGRRGSGADPLAQPFCCRGGGEDSEVEAAVHVCRTARVPEPAEPQRVLFLSVHKTGIIGSRAMCGHAVNEMIRRGADQAGFTPAQTGRLGGHSLRSGFVTEAFRADGLNDRPGYSRLQPTRAPAAHGSSCVSRRRSSCMYL